MSIFTKIQIGYFLILITIQIITALHFHVIEMNLMDLKQLAMAAEINLRLTIKKAIKMKSKSVLMPSS